jgi:hypothetical protein
MVKGAEVHHLRYPRHCLPGSAAWIAQEKLRDLEHLCSACHAAAHRRTRVDLIDGWVFQEFGLVVVVIAALWWLGVLR